MPYARTMCNLVAYVGLLFGGLFDNSTLYLSGTMGTPYVKGNIELEDDYNYCFLISLQRNFIKEMKVH